MLMMSLFISPTNYFTFRKTSQVLRISSLLPSACEGTDKVRSKRGLRWRRTGRGCPEQLQALYIVDQSSCFGLRWDAHAQNASRRHLWLSPASAVRSWRRSSAGNGDFDCSLRCCGLHASSCSFNAGVGV